MTDLVIEDLTVDVDGETILDGLTLTVHGESVQALMGPNGSGKSTLAYALMGHPAYTVTGGSVTYKGENLLELDPDERAKHGLFLGFQYPESITGVSVSNFLRTAYNNVNNEEIPVPLFHRRLKEKMALLDIGEGFADRAINKGFSGGEKKRVEVLQALVLEPEIAVFDEADSGLDIDALQLVADGINTLHNDGTGVLLITHYERILDHVKPDTVHVMVDGQIVETGDHTLAQQVEAEGYDQFQ